MKLFAITWLSVFATVTGAVVANGQTAAERAATEVSGEAFVRAFIGNCGQNPGHFDRVVAVSKTIGFVELPEELKGMVAPLDPDDEFIGFFAQTGEASPYVLVVSKSIIDSLAIVTCTISNPYVDITDVVTALEEFILIGRPDEDEIAMGQRYRIWFTEDWSEGSYISLIDTEPMGYEGVTLGISAPSIN